VGWNLSANFGLSSITISQDDGIDDAIVAGVTLRASTPEPARMIPMASSLVGSGFLLHRRRRRFAA
jgi:hypothetical protein